MQYSERRGRQGERERCRWGGGPGDEEVHRVNGRTDGDWTKIQRPGEVNVRVFGQNQSVSRTVGLGGGDEGRRGLPPPDGIKDDGRGIKSEMQGDAERP